MKINEVTIYEISYKKFKDLIDKWNGKCNIDRTLFLTKDNNKYLTIDNEAGECFTEEFDNKEKAICWLVRKDYSANEIQKLNLEIINKLLSEEKYKIISSEVEYGL